jgi:ornithine cyclodeaminase/alanine dehydrogenase-like protein (mu-crystallin family)
MHTLVLNHGDVLRHLDTLSLLSEMRAAFTADATRRLAEPTLTRSVPRAGASTSVLMPGMVEGIAAYSVQVLTGSASGGMQGMLLLHHLDTGKLLALMDAAHLSTLRSAVVAALGAEVLSRPDASRVALVGAAAPAAVHLKCLRLVRSLTQLRVFDEDHGRAFELAARMQTTLHLPSRSTNTVEEAVADADIVVVVGTAREPLVRPEMLRPGCHINSLGLETQGRRGVALEQFGGAVFCDHRGLAEAHGAAGNLGLSSGTELGEVLAGRAHGRTSAEQLTVFSHLGLPFQDLVAAWQVYQGAVDDEAITRLDFSA